MTNVVPFYLCPLLLCIFVEKNGQHIFGKSVQWKIAFKLTTKSIQTLQICCKTVNINVAWSKNNIIIHSLLTLQLFESAITPDFVAVYTACQLPIGRIAVLG